MTQVLLVEDDILVRRAFRRVLKEYSVIEVPDGDEALALIEAGNVPDIIISDIRMPKMWGTDLCIQVRARYPKMPFIFVSSEPDLERTAQEFGANGYAHKPVESTRLRELVRLNLDRTKT